MAVKVCTSPLCEIGHLFSGAASSVTGSVVGALASAAIEGGVEMVTWPAIETKQTGVPAASPRSWFGSILSLVADYAATGLPPAYLPKHDADDEPSEDP